ncbi:hypothetical protein CW304_18645 [Bacillus sp. UFRGS-B20]|nr:hypothetical protein CW304_18645 [Bacillus sp. UFRGS-B20]
MIYKFVDMSHITSSITFTAIHLRCAYCRYVIKSHYHLFCSPTCQNEHFPFFSDNSLYVSTLTFFVLYVFHKVLKHLLLNNLDNIGIILVEKYCRHTETSRKNESRDLVFDA